MAVIDDDALDQLFRKGRSFNGYTDEPVREEELHAIWDLMKMGPTSANQLPARLVWCTSDEAKEKLAVLTTGNNGDKIREAPVSVVFGMDTEFHEHLPTLFPHADARSWFVKDEAARERSAFLNASLQGGYFILAARALGLDTGPMAGFDRQGVDRAFFADQPSVQTLFISTLGHGDPSSIFERLPRPGFETFNRVA